MHQNQNFAQELGSANGADAALCARAKADLAAARVALKEGTDVETARIARFEEERVKRERKVCFVLQCSFRGPTSCGHALSCCRQSGVLLQARKNKHAMSCL